MGSVSGDQVEISLTPSVVIPIVGRDNNVYKVRTMLDSGSESNWVSKQILPFIKFSKINKIRLNIKHFNGSTPQKFEIVQVYMLSGVLVGASGVQESESECINESINCLVYDGFFYHKIVPGLKEFIKENGAIARRIWDNIVDPEESVSHNDLNLGTALVLSNAGKMKVLNHNLRPVYIKKLEMLLEGTKFGYVPSGKVPQVLKSRVRELQMGCFSPSIDNKVRYEISYNFMGFQSMMNPGEANQDESLGEELRCLWEKELCLGIMKDESHSNDDRAREIFSEGVKFDQENNMYVTPLPFNGKEIFLKTNEAVARART